MSRVQQAAGQDRYQTCSVHSGFGREEGQVNPFAPDQQRRSSASHIRRSSHQKSLPGDRIGDQQPQPRFIFWVCTKSVMMEIGLKIFCVCSSSHFVFVSRRKSL